MRVASYNVENLFARPKAMNLETWADGKAILDAHTALNSLIRKEKYTAAVKRNLLALLEEQGMLKT